MLRPSDPALADGLEQQEPGGHADVQAGGACRGRDAEDPLGVGEPGPGEPPVLAADDELSVLPPLKGG